MQTLNHDNQPGGTTFTIEIFNSLLLAAEYLLGNIERTPKKSILGIDCVEIDGDVSTRVAPLVDCYRYKKEARVIKECRNLLELLSKTP